jgi:hypothetical protein
MKTLFLSAAFVAAIATPAFAQSHHPEYGGANINAPYASVYGDQGYGDDAYADAYGFAPRAHSQNGRVLNSAASVYSWPHEQH